MRYIYDSGLAPDALSASTISFCALLLCSFLTGVGSNGGFGGAVNSTAKTFPDRAVCTFFFLVFFFFAKVIFLTTPCQRASTTGLVISGYGLSAFLFSTISHIFFAGSASSFLLVLALGSSFPMILGFFFVRPIPLPEEEDPVVNRESCPSAHEHPDSSHARLLNHDEGKRQISEQDDDLYLNRRRCRIESNPFSK